MNLIKIVCRLFLLLSLSLYIKSEVYAKVLEFNIRGGLPNTREKILAGEEVRIAFLGGSITAAKGWRDHTLEILRRLYPSARFQEIFAAVPGTGSDYGATRLERDVLQYKPDLLLVEFAVNDIKTNKRDVLAQMESIVRQTWSKMPNTDICFIYTVNLKMIERIRTGGHPGDVEAMETVAKQYNIPSIQFGIEVAFRMNDNTLVFYAPSSIKADTKGNDPQGRLIFTRDKTHPTPAGHLVYAKVIAQTLPIILRQNAPKEHTLPSPLIQENWQDAQILTIPDNANNPAWEKLLPDSPAVKAAGHMAPPAWRAMFPGTSIEFRFKGNRFGFIGLKSADSGQFNCYIDGELVTTDTLFDSYCTPGRYVLRPWFYKKLLPYTEHHIRIELAQTSQDKLSVMRKKGRHISNPAIYEQNYLYFCGFLLVGHITSSPVLKSPNSK